MAPNWRSTLAVAAIGATVFLAGLGSTRLWDEDEPKNAVCGQEMFARGDWVVPTFNNELRTDKPILLYWGMLTAYNVFGVSEWTARLPSALAGIMSVVLTFHLGRLLFNRRSGFIASCLLASALMYCALARGATPDSVLIVWITASLYFFVAGVAATRGGLFSAATNQPSDFETLYKQKLPVWACIGMYIAIGMAILAKGPIGIVMPIGIIGSFLIFFCKSDVDAPESTLPQKLARTFAPRQILQIVKTLRLTWGLLLAAAIALPWYIAVALQTNGEWVAGFIGKHNVGRFLESMERHRGPPIYYVVAILIGFFPGSVFLPVALWSLVPEIRRRTVFRSTAGFLLCWIGCYFLFFTAAATKLPNYVVPCYPAIAIAVGFWLSNAIDRCQARDWRLWAGYGTLVTCGIGIAVALYVIAPKFVDVNVLAGLPGLLVAAGGIACLALLYLSRVRASIVTFVVTCLMFTTSAMTFTAQCADGPRDGPSLAQSARELAGDSSHAATRVATYHYFTPSLIYYLGHPVTRLSTPEQVALFFEQGGEALILSRKTYDKQRQLLPNDLIVRAEVSRFLRPDERVVLVSRPIEFAKGAVHEQSR